MLPSSNKSVRRFFVQAFLYLTSLHLVYAQPIPSNSQLQQQVPICASCCPVPIQKRTLQEIIVSCLATMFASTWIAVHPNVPSSRDFWTFIKKPRFNIPKQRLYIMLWATITPELILWWAIKQWYGARAIAKRYKEHGWTKTHGHFVQMGGFILQDGDKTHVLSIDEIEELVNESRIDLPKITEEEIEDRSKADILAKGLVAIQVGWFIAQFFVRWTGKKTLFITELELVTLMHAIFAVFMYSFWWSKPLDVRYPIIVHLKPSSSTHPHPKQVVAHDKKGNDWITIIYERMQDLISSSTIPHHSNRVPTFYALDRRIVSITKHAIGLVILAPTLLIISFVQTSVSHSWTEEFLWQLCLFIQICVSTMYFLYVLLYKPISWIFKSLFAFLPTFKKSKVRTPRTTPRGGSKFLRNTKRIMVVFVLLILITSRLMLLVISFTTLRGLQAEAFNDIPWLHNVPHF